MRYSFNAKELNNWKGVITERLVEQFIDDVIIPSLKNEWDYAIFRRSFPLHSGVLHFSPRKGTDMFQRTSGQFFIGNGVFPSNDLLTKMEKLTKLLEGRHFPDGFLFKLKKTNETKTLKQALLKFGLEGFLKGEWGGGSVTEFSLGDYSVERHYPSGFIGSEHDENEQLPVVNGEVEVIEVKSGKGELKSYQKKDYIDIVNSGYTLRYLHVEIISFERNQFEISEKVFQKACELGRLETYKNSSLRWQKIL